MTSAARSTVVDEQTPATDIVVDAHYDLVIIGTGSGNSIPGPELDDRSIAIVEKGTFGGTCLNVGCIPTKMYVYAADVALEARQSGRLGLQADVSVDWPSIVDRVFEQRIDPIATSGEAYRRGPQTPNIDVYDQHAVFVGERTLRTGQGTEQRIISGDQVVIAAGSRPFVPEAIAASGVRYHTNEDIMRLPELPKSLVIIGGGYIAMEFAHVFDALGTEVTIVSRSPLLRRLDSDLREPFNELAAARYEVRSGRTAIGADESADGVTVRLDDGSSVTGEVLLVATGRTPNGDQLDLASGGVAMTPDGRVEVDEYGRSTSAAGVWALGDVSSPYMLKHVANAEMRTVRHNLLHPEDLRPLPHEHVPSATFTHPQIATVGLTEEEARAQGYDVTAKVQRYADVAYGWAMEDTTGIAKLVADRATGRLLGAHYMGPQAATLIQQMITVLAFDLDVREVATRQYWIHPALPEVTENALLGLDFD